MLARAVDFTFYELPRRARIERLRHSARAALAAYGIEPLKLRFVRSSHAIFRVETLTGQRYLLKFGVRVDPGHDHGFDVEPWIGAHGTDLHLQVHWQEALARETVNARG